MFLFPCNITHTPGSSQQCSGCSQTTAANFSLTICSCLKTWTDASVDCQTRGMNLAEIKDSKTETVVSRELRNFGTGSLNEAWIGGKIQTTDWTWVNSKFEINSF